MPHCAYAAGFTAFNNGYILTGNECESFLAGFNDASIDHLIP